MMKSHQTKLKCSVPFLLYRYGLKWAMQELQMRKKLSAAKNWSSMLLSSKILKNRIFGEVFIDYCSCLFAGNESGSRVVTCLNGSFMCPNCGKMYKHKTSVYTHLKNDCGQSPKYYCKPCNFTCKYDHLLRRHYLSMAHRRKIQFLITRCPPMSQLI